MTVLVSKPAINIRDQLAELKAQQGYEERQFHFDNLVTNGTFDTDTSGWTGFNSGVLSLASGELVVTNGAAAYGRGYTTVPTVVGAAYSVTLDRTGGTSSNFDVHVRQSAVTGAIDFNSGVETTNGSFTYTFVAGSTTSVIRLGNATTTSGLTSTFDNISVYEVDPNDSNKVIHTMPKGWKPLHVFEDGALQREGSAYDYTVEYDGFNYVIKETVAPVAPYSTTVIGVRA